MKFIDLLLIGAIIAITFGILDALMLLILKRNIEKIKKQKKGIIYHYAKMKLGKKFYTL